MEIKAIRELVRKSKTEGGRRGRDEGAVKSRLKDLPSKLQHNSSPVHMARIRFWWILVLIPVLNSLRIGSSISQKLFPKGFAHFIPWKLSRSHENRIIPVTELTIPIPSSSFQSSGRNSRNSRILQVSSCTSVSSYNLKITLSGIAFIS
jgi:hypothetical protein